MSARLDWDRVNRERGHSKQDVPDPWYTDGAFHPGLGDHGDCPLCGEPVLVSQYVKCWTRSPRVLAHVDCARRLA